MIELFDMGKYNFFVWGSVLVFFVLLTADFISIKTQLKNIKKVIKSKDIKAKNRRNQS